MFHFKKNIFKTSDEVELYTYKWLPGGGICEQSSPGVNTGYLKYPTLLKVTDDGTDRPLDIDNNLCIESGLPQDSKLNTIGQPDYIEPYFDTITCPIWTKYSYKRDESQIEGDPSFHIPYVEYTDTNGNPAVFYPDQFTDACGSFYALSIDNVVYSEVCP